MVNLSFEHEGRTYERVSRRKAEKAFYSGETLFICPCNMRPFGVWGMGVRISDCGRAFEKIVNEFEFYNCSGSETGRYAAFYRKKEI